MAENRSDKQSTFNISGATEVRLQNLSKSFHSLRGKVEVLKSLDLTIFPGEFFVLLGPSGCGKSTTLNLIAGLEKPSEGTISFSEKIVADANKSVSLAPFERDISFVFQSYALYPHMTIEQNLEFPLTNLKQKPSKPERIRRVHEASRILKIENLLDRKPSELSGGQRQRVAIGRAIVRNPTLFLMDEPLSNLDAKLRMEMRAEIKTIQQKLGITTVYVTHDQIEAMTLGDRIAILDNGIIQQVATPREIYSTPQNEFVATFIGSPPMNMLEGTVSQKGDITEFIAGDLVIRIDEPLRAKLISHLGKRLLLGVRPEAVSIVRDSGDMRISFDVIENLGPEYLMHAFLSEGRKFKALSKEPPLDKDAVDLKLDMNRVHLFDADSKVRL